MRDIVVHQAGNAEELARVLGAHLAGQPVATRGFEEREGPLRSLNDADLWDALLDRMATLDDVAAAAEAVPADTDVAWTGRTMKVPCFAEHMREGLVLHGWDITGDEAAAQARLAEPWMTSHSVLAVGRPLLVKGPRNSDPASESKPACERTASTTSSWPPTRTGSPSTLPLRKARPRSKPTRPRRVLLLWGAGPPIRHAFAAASDRRLWDACAAYSAVAEPLRAKRSAQKLLQVTATWLMSA